MAPTAYRVVPLPRLEANPQSQTHAYAIAKRYRDFRLHALKTSPEAFASTYEIESQSDLDQTLERLTNPKATTYIAVDQNMAEIIASSAREGHRLSCLARSEWFGMIVLLGPDSEQSPGAVSAKTDPFPNMTEVLQAGKDPDQVMEDYVKIPLTYHFHLNGVFVDPLARRCGLGKALIDAALEKGSKLARQAQAGLRCTIIVDEYNEAARRLYQKARFEIVSKETYSQQPRGLVAGESEASERVALHMELAREAI